MSILLEFAELVIAEQNRCANLCKHSIQNICTALPNNIPKSLVNKKIAMVWIMTDMNKILQWWSGTVIRCRGNLAIIQWDGEKGTRQTRLSKKKYTTDPRAPAGSWFIIEA